MALAIRSAISFLGVSAVAGMIIVGCSSSSNSDDGVTGGTKGTTGGTKGTTGGTKGTTGGTKAVGGTTGVTTGGTRATGGTANATGGISATLATGGTKSTGGATAAIGGTSAAVGGTTAAAVGGTAAAVGGTTAAVGGTAATGGATSTLPACSTSTTDAGPIEVCSPPASVNPGNTGTSADRDPNTDPYLGTYQYHVFNGVIQLYGTVSAAGRFWQGSPYTDAICAGRGVDATGDAGLRVVLKNNAANPITLDLYVKDQAGEGPTYTTVPLKKSIDVAAGGPSAQPVTIDVPFTSFVAECSTTVPFNPATIMQLGLGFGSIGNLDITISSFTFY